MCIIKNVLIYRHPSALVAWEHALSIDNGRISVYHAADLSTLPLRPTCFPRYFLHLGYDWSLCLSQLTPAIRCDFDVVSSGLPPPFPSLRTCFRSLPLLSQDCVFSSFGSVSFASAIPRPSCFSIFSLQPSSLFDPSPCIYPAGAYCFSGRRGIRTPA